MQKIGWTLLLVSALGLTGCGDHAPKDDQSFAAVLKMAEKGNADAQYKIGLMYDKGEGVATDDVKAVEWYHKAAEQGNTEAQLNLGIRYEFGLGVSKDEVKAFEWNRKAAEQGNAGAQYNLGEAYSSGSGVIKDEVKAVEWYRKVVDQYRKAAEQGNAEAQRKLGSMYEYGQGVSKDEVKAVEWYRKAAEQGNADAQNNLGSAYSSGSGVTKDEVKAVEWYRKAADQGNEFAQYFLGEMYERGEGVPKDEVKAEEWFRKAGAQGVVGRLFLKDKYFTRGEDCYFGRGRPKDVVKAVESFRQAAEYGSVDAQTKLGYMYGSGEGVPKDAVKSAEWFGKAAVQGNANAQRGLGRSYYYGEGNAKNIVLAHVWLNLAAAQGDPSIVKGRDFIENSMSRSELAEAQRIAATWKPGIGLDLGAQNAGAPAAAAVAGKLTKQGTGTAFGVSKSGHAITNHHVTQGCTELRMEGREGLVKLITEDKVNDLALLSIPGEVKATAPLNEAPGKLRQGEDVVVFGFPLSAVLSSGGNLTPGVISATTGLDNNTNQIQITAPIQPGSSGSPVLNKKGEVVAVVSMKLSDTKMVRATGSVGQNVNFAVSGQTLKAFLDANKVEYKTGGFFSFEKKTADIAEEARKWTTVIECWK